MTSTIEGGRYGAGSTNIFLNSNGVRFKTLGARVQLELG